MYMWLEMRTTGCNPTSIHNEDDIKLRSDDVRGTFVGAKRKWVITGLDNEVLLVSITLMEPMENNPWMILNKKYATIKDLQMKSIYENMPTSYIHASMFRLHAIQPFHTKYA